MLVSLLILIQAAVDLPTDRRTSHQCQDLLKQSVALTGRNTTGPPRAAPW